MTVFFFAVDESLLRNDVVYPGILASMINGGSLEEDLLAMNERLNEIRDDFGCANQVCRLFIFSSATRV